jgi:hypothetical protein
MRKNYKMMNQLKIINQKWNYNLKLVGVRFYKIKMI